MRKFPIYEKIRNKLGKSQQSWTFSEIRGEFRGQSLKPAGVLLEDFSFLPFQCGLALKKCCYVETYLPTPKSRQDIIYIYMYICIYIYIHTYIHTYIHMNLEKGNMNSPQETLLLLHSLLRPSVCTNEHGEEPQVKLDRFLHFSRQLEGLGIHFGAYLRAEINFSQIDTPFH